MKNHYITIDELKQKYGNREYEVFIWGFSAKNNLAKALELFVGDRVKAYLDNNPAMWGKLANGHEIVSPNKLYESVCPMVIVNDYYSKELSPQLEAMGIDSYYILTDWWHAYEWGDLLSDKEILGTLLDRDKGESSGRVLVKVLDGLGDNIIRLPLLKQLSQIEDIDNYYFLIAKKANYNIYRKLFKNVYCLDSNKLIGNKEYRIEVLKWVNEQYFDYSICFCATKVVHNSFDFFWEQNTNIVKNISLYEYLETESGYLKNDEAVARMAEDIWAMKEMADNHKELIETLIEDKETDKVPTGDYLIINMIGDSWGACYPAEKMAEIIGYYVGNGYHIILAGAGEMAQKYYDLLEQKLVCDRDKVINYCDRTSIEEMVYLIKHSSVFVGIDSGLAHVAYYLEVPTVVLMPYHIFSRRVNEHEGDNIVYLAERYECSNCEICKYDKAGEKGKCVSDISVRKMIDAISERMSYNTKK